MNKLWSPWRSQYIESFAEKKSARGCIFCEASKEAPGDPESLVVEKGNLTFTLLNLYPYNNGHLMIVPYNHKKDLTLLTAEENSEMMEKIQNAVEALRLFSSPEGFNIGANIGKVSGAGIEEHVHFHVVPRWNGDTNFMPVLGEVKIISQDLLITKKKLIEAYHRIKKS